MNSPLRTFLTIALLLATPVTAILAGDGETPSASGAPTILILVRHAEKTAGGPDPSLSDAGQARARELAFVLADVGVDALYSSQYRRTSLTLEPLGNRLDLETRVAPIEGDIEDWARSFAMKLLEAHTGQTVVIAGHSNTVPVLLRALGAADAPDLNEAQYDNLFWVVHTGDQATLVHQHYGAPSE